MRRCLHPAEALRTAVKRHLPRVEMAGCQPIKARNEVQAIWALCRTTDQAAATVAGMACSGRRPRGRHDHEPARDLLTGKARRIKLSRPIYLVGSSPTEPPVTSTGGTGPASGARQQPVPRSASRHGSTTGSATPGFNSRIGKTEPIAGRCTLEGRPRGGRSTSTCRSDRARRSSPVVVAGLQDDQVVAVDQVDEAVLFADAA